jgi:hypothetical protein
VNEAQNFFKHTDRDREAVLEFKPPLVEFVLCDCVAMYDLIGRRRLREGLAFLGWFYVHHPDVLRPGPMANALAAAELGEPVQSDKAVLLGLLDQEDWWRQFPNFERGQP